MTYGSELTRARLAAGVTQAALAGRIKVKRETVSRWERDIMKVTPSPEEMHRLCEQLPELTEVHLLWTLGYNLRPLVDDEGRLLVPDQVALEMSLSGDETLLVELFRKLPPFLRQVTLAQVQATLPLIPGQ